MTSRTLRMIAALGVLAAVMLVPSCGGGAPPTEPPSPTTTSEASHNDADVTFAMNMIAHLAQSSQLEGLAVSNAGNEQLIALANQLNSQQQSDHQAYSAWLLQWGEDPHAVNPAASSVPGAVDGATLARLRTSTGPDFDTPWLNTMITHEQGMVIMAQLEVARGQNEDIVSLARLRMGTQRVYIDRMKNMLRG